MRSCGFRTATRPYRFLAATRNWWRPGIADAPGRKSSKDLRRTARPRPGRSRAFHEKAQGRNSRHEAGGTSWCWDRGTAYPDCRGLAAEGKHSAGSSRPDGYRDPPRGSDWATAGKCALGWRVASRIHDWPRLERGPTQVRESRQRPASVGGNRIGETDATHRRGCGTGSRRFPSRWAHRPRTLHRSSVSVAPQGPAAKPPRMSSNKEG